MAIKRSYNRWLADRCRQTNGRLRWVCLPPLTDIPAAIEEVRFAKANGACGVMKKGDAEAALKDANLVKIEQTYITPTETHNPIEMSGTIALWEGDKKFGVAVRLKENERQMENIKNILVDTPARPLPGAGGTPRALLRRRAPAVQHAPDLGALAGRGSLQAGRAMASCPASCHGSRAGWNHPARRPGEGGTAAVISCADKTCSDWPFPPAAQ